jgi:hypothetical protein
MALEREECKKEINKICIKLSSYHCFLYIYIYIYIYIQFMIMDHELHIHIDIKLYCALCISK